MIWDMIYIYRHNIPRTQIYNPYIFSDSTHKMEGQPSKNEESWVLGVYTTNFSFNNQKQTPSRVDVRGTARHSPPNMAWKRQSDKSSSIKSAVSCCMLLFWLLVRAWLFCERALFGMVKKLPFQRLLVTSNDRG